MCFLARDIQGCEMVPLGPLNGKAFGTSISPWVITLDALSPFKTAGPKPEVALASHLEDVAESGYAIDMKVELLVGDQVTPISESKVQDLHWSGRQMCAHLASIGADLQTGDILGTGTVSGPDEGSLGCLLEITKAGKEPVTLSDGAKKALFTGLGCRSYDSCSRRINFRGWIRRMCGPAATSKGAVKHLPGAFLN